MNTSNDIEKDKINELAKIREILEGELPEIRRTLENIRTQLVINAQHDGMNR